MYRWGHKDDNMQLSQTITLSGWSVADELLVGIITEAARANINIPYKCCFGAHYSTSANLPTVNLALKCYPLLSHLYACRIVHVGRLIGCLALFWLQDCLEMCIDKLLLLLNNSLFIPDSACRQIILWDSSQNEIQMRCYSEATLYFVVAIQSKSSSRAFRCNYASFTQSQSLSRRHKQYGSLLLDSCRSNTQSQRRVLSHICY